MTNLVKPPKKSRTNPGPGFEVALAVAFQSFAKFARRRIKVLTAKDWEKLTLLAGEFKDTTEQEQQEIIEAMTEVLFPNETIGLPFDPTKLISDETKARLTMYRKRVGEQVRKAREALKMTQDELAKKAGIRQSHISRIERGVHTTTSMTMSKLAKALKTKLSDLDPGYNDED